MAAMAKLRVFVVQEPVVAASCLIAGFGLFLPSVVRPILDSWETAKQAPQPALSGVVAGPARTVVGEVIWLATGLWPGAENMEGGSLGSLLGFPGASSHMKGIEPGSFNGGVTIPGVSGRFAAGRVKKVIFGAGAVGVVESIGVVWEYSTTSFFSLC
ncbi:hypothetical protein J5N97_019711 [Dioscorea zingiberensis]|uniref:Uncharacterized protein n=1 Tax=Dioscorea zingiberensis TaxID=325984 RepID=A0A9D5CEC9_9LILI|nr:hypothetical protein J5N97_019711 [Dioscorea zingiberensis]